MASGKVCRRNTGGFVFVKRLQGGSGLGEHSDVTIAGGGVVITVSPNGTATLADAGITHIG